MKTRTSKDIVVGAHFGRWTVLEVGVKNPNSKAKNPPRMALCQCECGTQRYKEYRDLYLERSLSCGCLRGEQIKEKNLKKGEIPLGSKFGYLTMIKDLGCRQQSSRNKSERWSLCRCICGREIEVRNNNLKTGGTQSCGCINSRGEKIINEILQQNNINFATQFTFNELIGVNGGRLRFDFAIFDKNNNLIKLIEFDGRQHYFGPDGDWHNSQPLEIIKANDKLKDNYCKEHNIKLIRIPYYDIGKISKEMLEL